MRILHGDGFRLREREEARETVISNLVMRFIIIMMMLMMIMMMQVVCVYLVLCQMELKKHCSDAHSARSMIDTLTFNAANLKEEQNNFIIKWRRLPFALYEALIFGV